MSWQVAKRLEWLAAELQALGLRKGDKLAVFSENSHKWLLLDGATLKCGAANVVRGVGAPLEELVYIYSDSDSKALVVQTVDLLQKLMAPDALMKQGVNKPEFVVVIDTGVFLFLLCPHLTTNSALRVDMCRCCFNFPACACASTCTCM